MSTGNDQGYTGGIMNMTGARPGEAFRYEGPTMVDQLWYSINFTSTYEAIEKFILPPPLKVDRDIPPEVQVLYFINPNCYAYDGEVVPYQGLMFMANTERGGRKGIAGWEYVDALHGDKSDMDMMGPWSVYFGMLKKMADINFLPISADEFEITVKRRGKKLIRMRLRVGEEISPDAVKSMNDANTKGTFTVRELPNRDYSGFVDRSICWAPSCENEIQRAWKADRGFIEFGHLPADPLDEIPVLGVSSEIVFQNFCSQRVFTAMELIEELPR